MLPTDNIRGTKAKVENHTKALEPAPHNYVGPTAATKGHLLPRAAADDEQKQTFATKSNRDPNKLGIESKQQPKT